MINYAFQLADFLPSLYKGIPRDPTTGDLPQNSLSIVFKIAGNIVQIIIFLAGIAAVIMIIVAGIMYITSSGNPEGLARAKRTITNAVIGLLLIIFAYSIVAFIVGKF